MKKNTSLFFILLVAISFSSFHTNNQCYYRILFGKGFYGDTVTFSMNGKTIFLKQYLKIHPSTGNTDLSIFLLPESDSTVSIAQQNNGKNRYAIWDQTIHLGQQWEQKDITFDCIINKRKYSATFKPSDKKYIYIHKKDNTIIIKDFENILPEE